MTDNNSIDTAALAREIDAAIDALPSLATARVRALRREYSRRLAKAEPRDVLDVALRLCEHPGFERRFVGYELVSNHRGALASLREKDLVRLAGTLDRWESVDTFGCYLAGPAWREHQISDGVVHKWARSKDRWWRRTALVCTVALNNTARGGRGDTPRTLDICRMLVDDRDDMVVKALSWALRELAKRDFSGVRAFLEEYESRLAARVLRETTNKLTTGLKNPRRNAE